MQAPLRPRSLGLPIGQMRSPQPRFLQGSHPEPPEVTHLLSGLPLLLLPLPSGGCSCTRTLCTQARRTAALPAGHAYVHLQPVRLLTRGGPCGPQQCRSLPTVAGRLVAHTAEPGSAGVLAPPARLARRLRLHSDCGGSSGCERSPPLSTPLALFFPCARDHFPIASLHCRASSLLPTPEGASGLAGRSGGFSAWSRLAVGDCPPVSGLLLPAGGPATAVCVGCGVMGVVVSGAGGRHPPSTPQQPPASTPKQARPMTA